MSGLLGRIDRMQLAVRDRTQAAGTFARLLGAELLREDRCAALGASRSVLALGESELELCQPHEPGPVRDFLERWGEGLYAAGAATAQLDTLAAHLTARGASFVREGNQLHLPAAALGGLPMVVSQRAQRPRVGPLSFLYEATHALDSDWHAVAQRYVDLFKLEASGFSDIASSRFGYQGTLTLFEAPACLDRIEISQTFADKPGAMRRFVERRGGDSFYMCFAETDDFGGLKRRLLEAGATLTARDGDIDAEKNVLWVHPKNLHGMLLGVSRETQAWEWSGRPERVRAAA